MKILMLCEFFNEKLEYQENLLVSYYLKNGHDVVLIASTIESVFDYYSGTKSNPILSSTYFYKGAKIIKLKNKYNFLNKIKKLIDITYILEEEKPDLIYVHDIIPNMLEAVKYKKKNPSCKMIMDYHADYSNSGKNWLSLRILHGFIRKKIFLDRCREHLSKIFTIVPGSARFLHEIYDVPYSQMELLPLGADTDLGKKIRESNTKQIIRDKLGIPSDAFVIFSGGKFESRKKFELVIKAVVNMGMSKVHLILIGDAGINNLDYKESLIELSKREKNIHFLGWLDSSDIYKHMDASDIAVFPASQSILWQQSISMGLPLVVGDTGGQSPEYLNKYGNIIIVPKDEISSETFEKEIQGFINNKEKQIEMQKGAFKITEEMLNWDNLIKKTLRFNNNEI